MLSCSYIVVRHNHILSHLPSGRADRQYQGLLFQFQAFLTFISNISLTNTTFLLESASRSRPTYMYLPCHRSRVVTTVTQKGHVEATCSMKMWMTTAIYSGIHATTWNSDTMQRPISRKISFSLRRRTTKSVPSIRIIGFIQLTRNKHFQNYCILLPPSVVRFP